jgi:hypothetical protein
MARLFAIALCKSFTKNEKTSNVQAETIHHNEIVFVACISTNNTNDLHYKLIRIVLTKISNSNVMTADKNTCSTKIDLPAYISPDADLDLQTKKT